MFRCEHCNTKVRPGRELCEACAEVIKLTAPAPTWAHRPCWGSGPHIINPAHPTQKAN